MDKKKGTILGYDVDLMSFEEALNFTTQNIENGINSQIITINPEMIELAHKNQEFSRLLKNADLVIPDGVGIKLALKINGIVQENIPGIEFSKELIKTAETKGYRVGLLGTKEEIIQKAKSKLLEECPKLNIVYTRNGYFCIEDEETIKDEIVKANPQILLAALGAPKQELFCEKLKEKLTGTAFIGVGGSFDVWSGVVQRAPKIWQNLGLEWLYRTIKEPQRFKRIFPTLPMFLIKVIIEAATTKK